MFSSLQNNDELVEMCPLGEQHLDTYRWYALKRHNKEGIRYFRSATYFL